MIKLKHQLAKDKYKKQQREYVREFRKHASNLGNIVLFQNLMIDAKMQIVRKLNSVKGLTDTFIRTANGYKVTNPEGYVAIDRVKGNAVKLVDRMEFSFNNFTAGMGQMKQFRDFYIGELSEFRVINKAQRRKMALRLKNLSNPQHIRKK